MQPISSIVESLLTKLLQLSNWLAACQILAALEDFRTCLGHTAVTQVTRQYFGPLWNSKPKESLAQLRSLGADYNCAVAQFRPRRSGLGKLLKLQLSLFRKKQTSQQLPTPFEASVTEKLAMKPMYSQGKLVRFTKACPECTVTSLCHSSTDSKRLANLAIKVHLWRIVMQPSRSSRLAKAQTQVHGANICKYGRKLGVLMCSMSKYQTNVETEGCGTATFSAGASSLWRFRKSVTLRSQQISAFLSSQWV